MKCYFSYFKLRFISSLQYRASALAGLSTQLFFGLVNICIFIAFFSSNNASTEMTLNQTITYIWLNQSFFALIYQFYKDNDLFEIIRTGNISYELARPKNLYLMWYFKIFGLRLASVILRCIPMLIIAILLPSPYNIMPPVSITNFLLFILSLVIGSILSTAISTLYPIIALKTLNEKGVLNLIVTTADLLSGVAIPIVYFPKFLRVISSFLPFQYVSDLPFQIYVGSMSINASLEGMLIQLVWVIIIVFLGYILMKQSLKRVCVQGG